MLKLTRNQADLLDAILESATEGFDDGTDPLRMTFEFRGDVAKLVRAWLSANVPCLDHDDDFGEKHE